MEVFAAAGLGVVAGRYDAFIIDLWGVVFEGGAPYAGAVEALAELKKLGKKVVFLTNSSRRVSLVAQALEDRGVTRDLYHGLLSSGEVLHHDLKARIEPFFASLGRKYYVYGPDRPTGIGEGLAYRQVDNIDDADWVLSTGLPSPTAGVEPCREFLEQVLDMRLPLVCANPDRVGLEQGRPMPGSGLVAVLYERMGGVVKWRGKPEAALFRYCLEGLEISDRKRVAIIGDSFETDMAGATATGIDGILVARGVHARELGYDGRTILPDTGRVAEMGRHYGVFPRCVIPALAW